MQFGLLRNTNFHQAALKQLTTSKNPEKTLKRVERLASWLDNHYHIPFTKIRVGWDSILGFIPGVGDALPFLFSLYIVFEAARLKMPSFLLLRMLINAIFDFIIGLVPVLGDFFDIHWKANTRNTTLMRNYLLRSKRRNGA
jgi:hypothetical protein